MTVFHYLMFYLLIWSNQIFSLSFVFSFLPIVFIYSQLYQRFGRKPVTLRLFTRQTKKGHTIIAECQIVSIHRKSYLQRFLHTLPFGAKKIPNLFWCEISVKAYSVFFRQTGIFYSPVASRYSSVPTSLQACLPAMMTLPLAYSYAYISMICGSESPSLSVAD